ncbi:RICIN domain-containing protein [Micromonospora sp. SCSIO 07396]
MGSDDMLDDALRGLARHAGQTGRLATVAEVRRRGDRRRRQRHVATAAVGVVVLGTLGAGFALARLAGPPQATVPVGPPATTSTPPTATPSAGPTPRTPATGGPTPGATDATPQGSATADPLRLGQRRYALVRSAAAEGAVSLLDDGRLGEVDGDEGRSLFVFVPQGSGTYLVRTAEPDADGDLACWQVRSSGSQPLTVAGAPCEPTEPRQLFSITVDGTADGQRTYAVSNNSAYLQYSSRRGLILEELGDAPLTTVFRFVDNGPAPQG